MGKLIIHLGAHRTGTTLIQHYLSEKSSELMDHGIFYAPIGGDTAHAVNVLREDQSAGAVREAAAAFLTRYDLQRETTVVSWEGMLGLPFAQRSIYGGVAPFLQMLAHIGEETGTDIIPILYIRNQPDFVTSWYAQLVKAGISETFDEYLKLVPTKSLHWSKVVNDIERALGPAHIEAYESIDIEPAAYADPILRLCDAPLSLLGQLPELRVNQSYGAEALRLAQFVNAHGNLNAEARAQFRKLLVSMVPGKGRPTLLSRMQIAKMLALYEPDNMSVLHRMHANHRVLSSYQSSPDAVSTRTSTAQKVTRNIRSLSQREPVPTIKCATMELSPLTTAMLPTPKAPSVRSLLADARLLRDQHKPDEALKLVQHVLKISPGHTAARRQAADLLVQLGRHDEAIEITRSLLNEEPLDLRSINRLRVIGIAVEGSPSAAIDFLATRGETPENALTAARYLNEFCFFDSAATIAQRGLAAEGITDEIAGNLCFELGFAKATQDRFEEAIEAFRRIPAGTTSARKSAGDHARCLIEIGREEEARTLLCEAGVYLGGPTPYNASLQALHYLDGDLKSAHASYRHRTTSAAIAEYFGMSSPIDLTITGNKRGSGVIVAEGGPGDELRFSSIYDELAKCFERLTITCDPRLHSLLARSFPNIDFLPCRRYRKEFAPGDLSDRSGLGDGRLVNFVSDAAAAAGKAADLVASVLDVLADLRTSRASCGRGNRLLPAPHLRDAWNSTIERHAASGVPIGIAWRSILNSKTRDRHYLSVADLAPLADLRAMFDFWVVQPRATAEELEQLRTFLPNVRIPESLDLVDDFEGQAALMSNLKAVISPLTTTGELAGMVGAAPVLLCRTHIASWRRNDDGSDAWYPSGRVVTGTPIWDKGALMNQVVVELRSMADTM